MAALLEKNKITTTSIPQLLNEMIQLANSIKKIKKKGEQFTYSAAATTCVDERWIEWRHVKRRESQHSVFISLQGFIERKLSLTVGAFPVFRLEQNAKTAVHTHTLSLTGTHTYTYTPIARTE